MNLGFQEVVLIIIIFLVLFGPDKIPEFARSMGKIYRELTSAMREVEETIKKEIEDEGTGAGDSGADKES